ncbi:Bromodomain-containing protein, partial [Stipitochalara longipes BDJ]
MTSILNRISNYRNEDGQDISKVLERIVNKQVLPDYFDIIKEPVAISTLRQKIAKRQYANFKDFVRDFALIFHNAQVYN